jgi:integrase
MARRKTGPRAWVRVSHRTKDAKVKRWEVLYEDGNRKRTKGGFASKQAAEHWRDHDSPAAKFNADQPWVDPAKGDVQFKTVAQEWLAAYNSRSGKARGYSQHAQVLNGPHTALFKDRRIGDITHGEVKAWLANLQATRSPSTVRHNFYTFRLVMRYALANGLLLRDPTVALSLPEQRDVNTQQAERPVLTPRQVNALIQATPEPWGMYVRLAAATGMRPEELTALQLRDLTDTAVRVRRVRVKDRTNKRWIYEDLPKTRRSRRTIDLDDYTANALTTYLGVVVPKLGDHTPLFPHAGDFRRGQRQRQTGTDVDWLDWTQPLRHGWFMMRYWAAARDAANLPPSTVFYDLRHFHASWLVGNLGQPGALTIVEISQRLGHASTKMTLDRYAHATPDRDKRNATAAMWETPDNVTPIRRQA